MTTNATHNRTSEDARGKPLRPFFLYLKPSEREKETTKTKQEREQRKTTRAKKDKRTKSRTKKMKNG